uniref:Putative casein kinase substrate phosphoprotein pp28 n=1 Tax=Xenopsylla cheopis TaxID=163159 RepID=A0A6M2DJQ2_XENCH
MPRGKYTNHKGRNRHFTNPEELEEQRKQEEQKKQWRRDHGNESSSEDEQVPSKAAGDKKKAPGLDSSDSESESETESSEDEKGKKKGVSGLIEVENPNRVQKKTKKLSTLNETLTDSSKPQLSRREREEVEKQKAQAHYQKLHSEGKTDQARSDLARLAIIKQQREEAAKRRELEKKEKEEAAAKKKLGR